MVDKSSGRPQGAAGKSLAAFEEPEQVGSDSSTIQSSTPSTVKSTQGPKLVIKVPARTAEEEVRKNPVEPPKASGSKSTKGKEKARGMSPPPPPATLEELEEARLSIKDVLGILGMTPDDFLRFRDEVNKQRVGAGLEPGPDMSNDLLKVFGIDPSAYSQVPDAIAIGIADAEAKSAGAQQGTPEPRINGGTRQSSPIDLSDDESNDGDADADFKFHDIPDEAYVNAYNNAFPERPVVRVGDRIDLKSHKPAVALEKEKEKEKLAVVSGPVSDAVDGVDMYGPSSALLSVDPRLIAMGRNGWHIPLTACTTANLNSINDGSRAKGAKQGNRSGINLHVLDLSAFGSEHAIDAQDWHEAWGNFLHFLPEICGPRETQRFRDHFDYLCQLEWFREEFSAVLEFDIKTRRIWFNAPADKKPFFQVGASTYVSQLSEIRLRKMNARFSGRPVQTGRFHPYAIAAPAATSYGAAPLSRPAQGTNHGRQQQPFQEGRAGEAAGGICLVCAGSGHRARDCSSTALRTGRPAHSIWANGKLVSSLGRRPICAAWNVGGVLPCKSSRCPKAPGCHSCSLCGAADHTATAARCL
ncbi:hypothetical protein K466DRAFT_607415 [Polyporus arcularius HHB13444]|uniref:CCHC-type domain-containing protein n=1 Tax=Polyporus arcularius HHB13444 TaxID=1314778 RepID=A0A5C3NLC4_9APHY|nr:hypothetical protein K466DRAFT_607415 [Polyporus arcularius HHB13444]